MALGLSVRVLRDSVKSVTLSFALSLPFRQLSSNSNQLLCSSNKCTLEPLIEPLHTVCTQWPLPNNTKHGLHLNRIYQEGTPTTLPLCTIGAVAVCIGAAVFVVGCAYCYPEYIDALPQACTVVFTVSLWRAFPKLEFPRWSPDFRACTKRPNVIMLRNRPACSIMVGVFSSSGVNDEVS